MRHALSSPSVSHRHQRVLSAPFPCFSVVASPSFLSSPLTCSSLLCVHQKLAASDDVPEKRDGIQEKSSLDDEHDLMKTESQDVATEHKPLFQVHQVSAVFVPQHDLPASGMPLG